MKEFDYFSQDYQCARKKFLDAAYAAGASIESVKNPRLGPDGLPLFMDVACIGDPEAKQTLVLCSGTHGVEGFAGSAIQTGLLSEGINSRLSKDQNILMIHGVNPFGMAHFRRVTEDNIDLNRNFRNHDTTCADNTPYEDLADVLAPRSLSLWSGIFFWARLLFHRITAGTVATQAAVSGGQYVHPDGLFYGGAFETWSNITFRMIIQRYLSTSTAAVLIDFHTGLGSFGAAEVIIHEPENSAEFRRAMRMWDSSMVKTTFAGDSVSTYLDSSLKSAISQMLPTVEVTAVSLEIGTIPPMQILKALRNENWLYHHGGKNHRKASQLKACLLRAFHPDSEEWEAMVWKHGVHVVERAMS